MSSDLFLILKAHLWPHSTVEVFLVKVLALHLFRIRRAYYFDTPLTFFALRILINIDSYIEGSWLDINCRARSLQDLNVFLFIKIFIPVWINSQFWERSTDLYFIWVIGSESGLPLSIEILLFMLDCILCCLKIGPICKASSLWLFKAT